jgi:hypothetical protein
MAQEKIYVKNVSVKEGKFGLKLSGKAEDVIAQIKANTNSRGYFNWNIDKRREVGKYGETHSVSVDTWEPTQKTEPAKTFAKDDGDLPF